MLFAVMVVALELALAMRSHSVKEAGSILGPAIILIIFPALFTQVINLDGIESFWFSIPVINILLALRELLLDRVIIEHVVIWMVTSLIYATMAAYYAARQFKVRRYCNNIVTECNQCIPYNIDDKIYFLGSDSEMWCKAECVVTAMYYAKSSASAPWFNCIKADNRVFFWDQFCIIAILSP